MAESAISFLLNQLYVVLRDEHKLLGDLEQQAQSMINDLVNLNHFLRIADSEEESYNHLKEWFGLLREISFDFQDVLDEYTLLVGRRRGTNRFTRLNDRHRIASEIKKLKQRLETALKSLQTYKDIYATHVNEGSTSTMTKKAEEPHVNDALFLEEDEVVGIEKAKEKLLEWIQSMDGGVGVISVVGTGGLGKTTLVKKVYDDESVESYFDRHVWVTVSDYNDDFKHLLVNLIMKLVGEIKDSPPQGLQYMSINDMRHFINVYLKEKKYIIVLDDVRRLTTCEDLISALPRRGAHGCIIITTRSKSIGTACCEAKHMYNLKPLSPQESEMLFFKKAFQRHPYSPHLRTFVDKILQRCEGLPLAIVVIGGLLATKSTIQEWELFNRSLCCDVQSNELERLWKLFSLSYNDLPYYLKYCFLYLSIFRKGDLMVKEQIIRLWIAEGFVQSQHHKILEEVAEEYLNELCNRSLIQVAHKYGDGKSWAFRIHDLLRDYITSKSREHNIVTIHKGGGKQSPNKLIRRLAIPKSDKFSVESNNFKHLRSLLLCNKSGMKIGTIKKILNKCRVLKVLDLRGALIETIPGAVFRLYHLKYLCIRNTKVKLIPASIKYLENLETLDLKNTNVIELPKEILKLKRLRHILVFSYGDRSYKRTSKLTFDDLGSFRAPYKIGGSLQSLQTLYCVDADEDGSIRIVEEIGMLTQLRDLRIAKVRSEDGKDLCYSIAKLTRLRTLQINSIGEDEKLELECCDLSSTDLPYLRKLHLYGCLEKVPQWISSLHALSSLCLWWCKLREDPLDCLQNLPNLRHLGIHGACVEALRFKAHGFPKLKILKLCELGMMKWVVVEDDSLPFLKEWMMVGCKLLAELPYGIEHLSNLQYLDFYDMPNEYMERVVEEKGRHEDNWRLARVLRVSFGTISYGSWSFVEL